MQRVLEMEVTVDAPPATVWSAWTTVEGVRTFFAPDARIEPRVGGPFEMLFDDKVPAGSRGSEGCRFLELSPPHRFSFDWNFPPQLPIRNEHTRVDVRLEPAGSGTRVTLTQTGWGEGPGWDEGFQYFDRAWGVVLARLHQRFAHGPIDWSQPYRPPPGDTRVIRR